MREEKGGKSRRGKDEDCTLVRSRLISKVDYEESRHELPKLP